MYHNNFNYHKLNHCSSCSLTIPLCLCSQIKQYNSKMAVNILIHAKEFSKTSNSARLAKLSVEQVNLFVFGEFTQNIGRPMDWSQVCKGENPAILFPRGQHILGENFKQIPDPLIIPDGNWSQATKMAAKLKIMRPDIPFVSFSHQEKSCYKLRTHPKLDYLSTFEAMACALSVYDGQELKTKLMENFHLFVKNSLQMRGHLQNV